MLNKMLTLSFVILLGIGSFSLASACQFLWTNPTTNTDGTPATDLALTTLYFQNNGGTVNVEGTATAPLATLTIPGACKKGAYWVTASNSLGVESGLSNIVTVRQPNAPTSLTGSK